MRLLPAATTTTATATTTLVAALASTSVARGGLLLVVVLTIEGAKLGKLGHDAHALALEPLLLLLDLSLGHLVAHGVQKEQGLGLNATQTTQRKGEETIKHSTYSGGLHGEAISLAELTSHALIADYEHHSISIEIITNDKRMNDIRAFWRAKAYCSSEARASMRCLATSSCCLNFSLWSIMFLI